MIDHDFKYDYVQGRITPEQYWDNILQSPAEISSAYAGDDPDLQNRLVSILTDLFWELNRLDRSDSFWAGSNNLATRAKLWNYVFYMLKKGKDPGKYAMAGLAVMFTNGSNPPDVLWWKILYEHGELEIDILVRTSLNCVFLRGMASAQYVADVAKEIHIVPQVIKYIKEEAEFNDENLKWAEYLLEVLSSV